MDWRRVAGLVVLTVAIAIPTAILGLPFAARGFVRAIVLLMDGCLWLAILISASPSLWSVAATVGRASAAALVTPTASWILIASLAISLFALYLLQRLLESKEESSK